MLLRIRLLTVSIDEHRRHCLINGLDDIGLTMQREDKIADYEAKLGADKPWA